jgi:hypothetical protein
MTPSEGFGYCLVTNDPVMVICARIGSRETVSPETISDRLAFFLGSWETMFWPSFKISRVSWIQRKDRAPSHLSIT